MKLRYIVYCALTLLLMFSTIGCSQQQEEYDLLEKNKSPFADCTERNVSEMFIGSLPSSDSHIAEIALSQSELRCEFLGREYIKVEPTEFPIWSNWQLDCDYLTVVGQTNEGKIVYAIENDDIGIISLLVLFSDKSHFECSWYITEDLDILNPCDYSIKDFDVEIIYGKNIQSRSIKKIWNYHIGEEYDFVRNSLRVDDTDSQVFFLRSKKNPWMVYELSVIQTYQGYFFMENLPNRGRILVTADGKDAYAYEEEQQGKGDYYGVP